MHRIVHKTVILKTKREKKKTKKAFSGTPETRRVNNTLSPGANEQIEQNRTENLFCFDLDNMFINYTIITYKSQEIKVSNIVNNVHVQKLHNTVYLINWKTNKA